MALRKVNESDRNTLLEVTEFNGMITAIDSSVIDNTYFKVASNVVFDNMGSVRKREGIEDYGVATYGEPLRQIYENIYPYKTNFLDIGGGEYNDLDIDIIEDGEYIAHDGFDGSNNFATEVDDYSVVDFRNTNNIFEIGTPKNIINTSSRKDRVVHGNDISYYQSRIPVTWDIFSLSNSFWLHPWYEDNFNVVFPSDLVDVVEDYHSRIDTGVLSDTVRKVFSIISTDTNWHVICFSGEPTNDPREAIGFFWSFTIRKSDKSVWDWYVSTIGIKDVSVLDPEKEFNLIETSSNDTFTSYKSARHLVPSGPVSIRKEDNTTIISPSFYEFTFTDVGQNNYGKYIGGIKYQGNTWEVFALGKRGINLVNIYGDYDTAIPIDDVYGDGTFIDISLDDDGLISHIWKPVYNSNGTLTDRVFPIYAKFELDEDGVAGDEVPNTRRLVKPMYQNITGWYTHQHHLFYEDNMISYVDTSNTINEYRPEMNVYYNQSDTWKEANSVINIKSTTDNVLRDLSFDILKTFDDDTEEYDDTYLWLWIEKLDEGLRRYQLGLVRDLIVDDVTTINITDPQWNLDLEGTTFDYIGIMFDKTRYEQGGLRYDPDSDIELSVGVNSFKLNVLSPGAIEPLDYNQKPVSTTKVPFEVFLTNDAGITYIESRGDLKFVGTTESRIILYGLRDEITTNEVKYINFGERQLIFVNGSAIKVLSFLENTNDVGEVEYYAVLNTYTQHADDRKNTFIEAQTFGYNLATENFAISIDPNKNNGTIGADVALQTILNNHINPTTADIIESTFVVDTVSEDVYNNEAEIKRQLLRRDGLGDYKEVTGKGDATFIDLFDNETISWGVLEPGNYLVKGFVKGVDGVEYESQISFVVDDIEDSVEYESVSEELNQCENISYAFGKMILYSNGKPQIYTSNIGDAFYISSQNIASTDVYNKNETVQNVFPYKDINLVFTNNTILALEGTGNLLGESPWRITGLESNIGLVGPNAIDAIDNTLMFQSKNGLYIVEDVVVSEKRISLTELSFPIKEEASPYIEVTTNDHQLIESVVVRNHDQRVYITYPGRKDRVLVYDYALTDPNAGRFSIWNSELDIDYMYVDHNNKLIVRGGKDRRKLYRKRDKVIGSIKERVFENGFYTDDGEDIEVILETHDTTLGDGYTFNKPKKLWVSTTNNITNASSYNVSILLDNTEVFNDDISVSVYNRPQTGQMVSGNQYTGYKESNNVYAKTILKSKVGRNTKVFITHNIDEPFEVNDFTIEFTSSKRKNRGSTT